MTPDVLTDETRSGKVRQAGSTVDDGGSDGVRSRGSPSHEILLERFQAVAEETRMGIVRVLADGERCVCDLQDAMGAAQSRLSFHLKKLKEAGVVSDRRQGRWVYYSLVPEALEEMRAFLGDMTDVGGAGPDGSGGSTGSRGSSVSDGANASAGSAHRSRDGSCCE